MGVINKTSVNSDFAKLFHSVLIEQMADAEAAFAASDNDNQTNIDQNEIFHRYAKFFIANIQSSYHNNRQANSSNSLSGSSNSFNDLPVVSSGDEFLLDDNPCHLITSTEVESHQNIAFQLELVVQPILVLIGFSFNTMAINILCR